MKRRYQKSREAQQKRIKKEQTITHLVRNSA
jgi:hypothetical protein